MYKIYNTLHSRFWYKVLTSEIGMDTRICTSYELELNVYYPNPRPPPNKTTQAEFHCNPYRQSLRLHVWSLQLTGHGMEQCIWTLVFQVKPVLQWPGLLLLSQWLGARYRMQASGMNASAAHPRSNALCQWSDPHRYREAKHMGDIITTWFQEKALYHIYIFKTQKIPRWNATSKITYKIATIETIELLALLMMFSKNV